MIFNSFQFFFFFAIAAVLYGLVKESSHRWYVLLFFSLAFYLSFGVEGIVYILFTSASTYLCALGIEKLHGNGNAKGKQKFLVTLGLLVNFGVLAVVKYFNFIVGGAMELFGTGFEPIDFYVALGISFYTFQMMGYLIDVYRQMETAQTNFLRLLLFASYFPQMIDGPINRYGDVKTRLFSPLPVEYERCRNALVLFAWGLFKKICVADNLKVYVDLIFKNYENYYGLLILSGAVAYAIYLYADFSGCIDMARGVSKYFGIDLKDNFERPYFSASVEEFWRRWHITLSTWFRDYLFYPLQRTKALKGLNNRLRKSGHKKAAKVIPTALALSVVWLTTGLWHGAKWTYVAWGVYYGIFMIAGVIRDTFIKKREKNENTSAVSLKFVTAFKIAGTFLIVCLGYILFYSDTLAQAVKMLINIFNVRYFVQVSEILSVGISFYKQVGSAVYFAVAVLSTALLIAHDVAEECGVDVCTWLGKRNRVVKYLLAVAVSFLLLFMMSRSSGDFTYMQF